MELNKRTGNRKRKELAGILKRDSEKKKESWNYNYTKLNLQNSKKPK